VLPVSQAATNVAFLASAVSQRGARKDEANGWFCSGWSECFEMPSLLLHCWLDIGRVISVLELSAKDLFSETGSNVE